MRNLVVLTGLYESIDTEGKNASLGIFIEIPWADPTAIKCIHKIFTLS